MTQVVLELGPHYFPFVIREMQHVMQRGYQVEIVVFCLDTRFLGSCAYLHDKHADWCHARSIEARKFGQLSRCDYEGDFRVLHIIKFLCL